MKGKKIKLPLFANGMIFYVDNSKDSTKKPLGTNKWVWEDCETQGEI